VRCSDATCLLISEYSGQITMLNATSTSLLLQLERAQPSARCSAESLPAVQYTVHYRQTVSVNPVLPSTICRPPDLSACHTEVKSFSLSLSLSVSLSVFRLHLATLLY